MTFDVQADPDPNTNDEPDANDDTSVTQKNTPTSGNALDNDIDLNTGDTLTVSSIDGITFTGNFTVTTPSGGTLQIFDVGTYNYTPANDFTGNENIVYTIEDGNGGTDTATIYLSVFDLPPQVEDDINVTSVNESVDGNVLLNDSSEPNDELVIGDGNGNPITGPVIMNTNQGGTLLINPDGSYIYTPPTDFVGEDTITLEVCDEGGNCVSNELTIDVADSTTNPENTPPIASNDNFVAFVDQTVSSSVVGNDGDPDGDVIGIVDPVTGILANTAVTITTTQGGTAVIQPSGAFVYTPATGFVGVDTFEYNIADPSGETDNATVSFTVTGDPDPAVNDEPDANDDVVVAQKNTTATGTALDNDTDPNGDPLLVSEIDGVAVVAGTATVVTTPNGGTIELSQDGSYVYNPANDFVGTESVTYTIVDVNGASDTATIVLSVFDNPPLADDDINATEIDVPVSGNVLTNDTDPNPNDDLTVVDPATGLAAATPVMLTTTGGGSVVINPDGTYEYTPATGFTGEDTFQYSVADENGNTDTANAVSYTHLTLPTKA